MKRFPDRHAAGRELAQKLLKYAGRSDAILLALPRGGVPVAYEISLALKVTLDVLIVRKLGVPGREELAIGAIASEGIQVLNEDIIRALKIDQTLINAVAEQEMKELQRREEQYRGNRPTLAVRDRVVILVDDGLATGASMLAAVSALHAQHPSQIIIAVPAVAPQAIRVLRPKVNEIISVISPDPFEGVGKWYENFSQNTDEEVQQLLKAASSQLHP